MPSSPDEELARDLAKILEHPSARVDYLAIAWPVVDETFEPYAMLMYSLLARTLYPRLFGVPETGMTDKSDSGGIP